MNKFKEQIRKGEKPVGIFAGLCSPLVTECLGIAGFDYVIIDNEHSPVEAETSLSMIRSAELRGVTPFVRVRETSRPAVMKLLDVGAQGLIVPNVSTVEEVQELISWAKYAPLGNRGFCASRKDGWGSSLCMSVPETMAYFNDEVLLVPQCETVGALEHIEAITALEGVDGIFIGPFDLSISMGIPGQFGAPEFQAAVQRVLKACHDHGKFCMMFAGDEAAVISGFARGIDTMTYSMDAILLTDYLKNTLAQLKEKI